ncbi:MAG: hypothetical protein ACTSUE_07775, partial [Promethearchaeota archaeon]
MGRTVGWGAFGFFASFAFNSARKLPGRAPPPPAGRGPGPEGGPIDAGGGGGGPIDAGGPMADGGGGGAASPNPGGGGAGAPLA